MTSKPAFVITTLAEYQTRFWLRVGQELAAMGVAARYISFDDRSTDMIRDAGFPVLDANQQSGKGEKGEWEDLLRKRGLNSLSFWTSHERVAFGRSDSHVMREKLARSVLAAEGALAEAKAAHDPVVMVQEIGGFLSVIGSYFAARAQGIDNWFIEPSFFRSRIALRRNTFAAPKIEGQAATVGADLRAYLEQTLANGSIVIPEKDAHHYRPAMNKVVNAANVKRLWEKLVDKYLLGKRQEFGLIGNHVKTHLNMIVGSYRLRKSYTSLESVGKFIYYPLHVPGDMALTIRSPEFVDQLALVDFLCRTCPDGYRIALKEHPAMVGAIPADRMQGLLNMHDNLVLLPPTTNNYAVMRAARCIVTVNSKSGAEAGLLGKRVFVLGDAFYRDAPFAVPVDRLGALPSLIEAEVQQSDKPVQEPAHLEWFQQAWDQSVPGEIYGQASGARTFAQSLLQILAATAVGAARI